MPAPDDFLTTVREMQRRIAALEQRSPFANTGMSITAPGQFEIDGTVTVTGDFIAEGKISSEALTDPTDFGFGGFSSTGFSIGTSSAAKTSVAIPVPVGFTRALVHCTVNASARNSTASSDFLYVSADITIPGGGGGTGGEAFSSVAAGGWGNAAASAAGEYSGMTSGSIVLACFVRAGAAWASNASNIANVDGTVTFLR